MTRVLTLQNRVVVFFAKTFASASAETGGSMQLLLQAGRGNATLAQLTQLGIARLDPVLGIHGELLN